MNKNRIFTSGLMIFFLFSIFTFSQVTLKKNLIIKKKFDKKVYLIGSIHLQGGKAGFHLSSSMDVRFEKSVIGYEILKLYLNSEVFSINSGNRYTLTTPINIKGLAIFILSVDIKKSGDKISKSVNVKLAEIEVKNFVTSVYPEFTSPVPYNTWKNGIKFNWSFKSGLENVDVELREVPPHGMIFNERSDIGTVLIPGNILKPETKYQLEQLSFAGNGSIIKYNYNVAAGSSVKFKYYYNTVFETSKNNIIILKK